MLKNIVIAAILSITGSAFAGDLSSVGTTGVEVVTDYSYARPVNTEPSDSTQVGLAGVQVNGRLGSLFAEAGVTRHVNNYTSFVVGYANGVKLGSANLVGSLSYNDTTGNKWFAGSNSSLPINVVTGTVEVNAPLVHSVRGFVDYSHAYTWSGDLNSFNTAVHTSSANSDGAAVGAYANLSKNLVAKVGYTRGFGNTGPDTQGVLASVAYKF